MRTKIIRKKAYSIKLIDVRDFFDTESCRQDSRAFTAEFFGLKGKMCRHFHFWNVCPGAESSLGGVMQRRRQQAAELRGNRCRKWQLCLFHWIHFFIQEHERQFGSKLLSFREWNIQPLFGRNPRYCALFFTKNVKLYKTDFWKSW